MYGHRSKPCIILAFKLLALFTPAVAFSQENKKQNIKWSYDYIEKATKIPMVQEVMLDSISQKLNLLHQYKTKILTQSQLRDTSFFNKVTDIKSNLKNLPLSQLYPSAFISKLPAFYSLKQATNFSRDAFSLNSLQLNNQTVYDNYFLADKQLLSTSELSFNSKLANIPFSYQFNYIYPSLLNQEFSAMYKAAFDQEQLLGDIKKQLVNQFDLEKILLKDFDFKQLFHDHAQSKLASIRETIIVSELKSLKDKINSFSTEEFLYLTKNQIREKLMSKEVLDSLLLSKEKITEALNTQTDRTQISSLIQQLQSTVATINGLNESIDKILSAKSEFETNGLNYNQLVNYQKAVNNNLDSITNSTGFIQESSKKLLKLKGLTKFFVYVKEMNLGKFSTNWSERSMSNILTSGAGGSFFKNNKFLGLNISNVQSLGWIKDNQFIANLQQPEAGIKSLRLGKGELQKNHSHTTFTNANIKNFKSTGNIFSLVPRNIFIGSFSKNLSLGSIGIIETEISKSSAQYNNTRSALNENQAESKMALKHLGEDFFQTLSVGVNYNANFNHIHFKPSFFANYSGLGYTNPASTSQSRGAVAYGMNVSKGFFANQLTVQTRVSKRVNRTAVADDDDNRFIQLQGALSTKYKFSRKIRAGLNWNYSSLSKVTANNHNKLFYSNRIYSDANFNGKLRNLPLFQVFNIGYQNISIPDMQDIALGKNFWVNSATSLAMNKGTLSINMQLFNQLDKSALQGDLLTTDLGWSYTLFKGVNITSAINYLNQSNIAKQLGMRHTVSTAVKDKFLISLFADVRKDLIQNNNSFMFPNTRGEIAVTYKLK
jgi:hypothetical protein